MFDRHISPQSGHAGVSPAHIPGWVHFAHAADIGVCGVGASAAEAFEQAALALTAVVTDPADVRPRTRVEVSCAAPELDLLLVDWLNAVVYEMATRNMLFSRFAVRLDDGALQATLAGEAVDVGRHHPAVEVKGATYTSLSVQRRADGLWEARCVVDV